MKLRNKKTGEIVELFGISCKGLRTFLQFHDKRGNFKFECETLAEVNEEWEDVPELSGYWYINEFGTPTEVTHTRESIYDKSRKSFGNYFETKEEAEKAVEKLKAWKSLKDNGFRFTDFDYNLDEASGQFRADGKIYFDMNTYAEFLEDLNLLFGGEE